MNHDDGMHRLIVYDLDGTLVDTLEDITASANHMLRELGAPIIPRDEVRRYVGSGLHELIGQCLKSDDEARITQGMQRYRAHYGQHLLDHSRIYPEAQDVLEHFKRRKQAVITNKPNPYSREILSRLGLDGYFLEIVAGDSEYPKKPDPTSLLAIMSREEIRPAETLVIGDSPIDVQMGREVGAFTVAVTHGFGEIGELTAAEPHVLVANFDELLELAKRLEW